MSKFLLFSLFLLSLAGPSRAATAAKTSAAPDRSTVTISQPIPESRSELDRIQADNSLGNDHIQAFVFKMPEAPSRISTENNLGADHVCLNIHAFIFKTNDEQVPELVDETTCMPASAAKAKKADGLAEPKLIPATGRNPF